MEENRSSATAAVAASSGTRRIARETAAKPTNAAATAAAAGSRITLRNYLDMSKSLNIEPGSSTTGAKQQQQQQQQQQHRRLHERARWDMFKSLNVESSLSSSSSSSTSVVAGLAGTCTAGGRNPGPAVSNCQQEQQQVARSGTTRKSSTSSSSLPTSQRASNASAADLVQSMKVLPASPSVMGSAQEQQLIEQLRSITTSSREQQLNRRRAVRRSLDFSNDDYVNYAETPAIAKAGRGHRKVEVVGPASAVVVAAAAPEEVEGLRRPGRRVVVVADHTSSQQQQQQQQLPQRKSKQHQHHLLLPSIEEKQTVISSPISHSHHLSKTTRIKSVDMAPVMQEHAVNCAFELLKSMDKQPSCKLVAWQLKKEFDKVYGPAWHCIVGTSFGSYVTHSVGGFIYFAVGKVSVLLFRTAIEVVPKKIVD